MHVRHRHSAIDCPGTSGASASWYWKLPTACSKHMIIDWLIIDVSSSSLSPSLLTVGPPAAAGAAARTGGSIAFRRRGNDPVRSKEVMARGLLARNCCEQSCSAVD